MAVFIKLFFLSIGLSFGSPDVQNISEVQNLKQSSSFKIKKFTPKSSTTSISKTLYRDKKNTARIYKVGSGGWVPGSH